MIAIPGIENRNNVRRRKSPVPVMARTRHLRDLCQNPRMSFSAAGIQTLAQVLRDAARAEIMPRFRNLAAGEIRQKSSHLDLVTAADVAAEARITAQLAAAFPGAVIVGEEAASREPSRLEALGGAELAFIVDPIDGTKNFASGLPLFGVMAGVLERGVAVAGVIHDPIVDDFAAGLRGGGAWLERPDGRRTPLRVAAARPVGEMLGMVSWMFMAEPLRSTVTANLPRVAGAADYRTAAHEYRLIAGGLYDFLMFGKLAPWDHVAGCLIHHEAGGHSACLDGTPYGFASRADGLLCAPDEASWKLLRDALVGEPRRPADT
jgi:fructose-1,6-bisphosphatase/inositol monophosphatase family enzyme